MRIEFFHPCHPEPQGSSSCFCRNNKPTVTSANKKLKPYRKGLTEAAKTHLFETTPYDLPAFKQHIPLCVEFEFTFARPKSVKRVFHVVKPDLDKLIRAACDALTGVVWHDDAQIIAFIRPRKLYGEVEGVHVIVEEAEISDPHTEASIARVREIMKEVAK